MQIVCLMTTDQGDEFDVRPGRVGNRGTRINARGNARSQPFLKQVQVAVRKAGGNPNRIGRGLNTGDGRKGNGSGRFNGRGRGAKLVPSFLQAERNGGWQRDSSGRFRSRRVAVKARIVKLNAPGWKRAFGGPAKAGAASKALDAHLRYLERDGVNRNGEKGRAYWLLKMRLTARPLSNGAARIGISS